ncbi:MAG: SAM-dependent DNA methyltransferase [Candidatus Thorarchaeota archaeon]|nr:MAG: SAM-dependent DNA methyltransferase [Candidatus Thorarchaeota archaeon]
MRYGIDYLLKRGMMADATKGTLHTDFGDVEFLHSALLRIFYVELDNDSSPREVFEILQSKYVFDYAWIVNDELSIFRTFGSGRVFRLPSAGVSKPPADVQVKLENLEPQGLPAIFNITDSLDKVSQHLWNVRMNLANSLDKQKSMKERLLSAQRLIEQVLISRFASKPECICSEINLSEFDDDSLSFVQQEMASYEFSLDETTVDNRILTPYVLNWIFETFTCALLNMTDDDITKSTNLKPLRRSNKKTGSFYTPEHLANDIVTRCLQSWLLDETGLNILSPTELDHASPSQRQHALESLRKVRILDPSAGAGVFLIAAAEWLVRARSALGDKRDRARIREEIITNNLYAVDIMEGATSMCQLRLRLWMNSGDEAGSGHDTINPLRNIRTGNSLVGRVRSCEEDPDYGCLIPFHWETEFPSVFQEVYNGFDVVVGNPPYGNILSEEERTVIKNQYGQYVNGGRNGTWNVASLFIVRSRFLLRTNGRLGLLLPNSILRVGQFAKTRQFMVENMKLEQIIDEGSPFDGVTLEMVSVFGRAASPDDDSPVHVLSRRPGLWETNKVPLHILGSGRLFVIYHDDLLGKIMQRGETGVLTAGRGRDIPHEHVKRENRGRFRVPYATSGRSVKRYRIDYDHVIHADDWFFGDPALTDSYNNEFLIATKNYPFPRCLMKPKGVLHGGGAVRIKALRDDLREEAIGLILNSTLSKFVCRRYLTNASQLTTCLNTGIMEEFPIIYPDDPAVFVLLFRTLQMLHQRTKHNEYRLEKEYLEKLSDALVYELYLLRGSKLMESVRQTLESIGDTATPELVFEALQRPSVIEKAQEIYTDPEVIRIRNSRLLAGA